MARSLSQLFYALGGSVSPGKSNDELIDHLIDAEFIRTPAIQRVFRSVDRGNYYHPNHRQNAYKDIAWRMGNLHLSAPCVYSVVMETLKLKPGLSFLNLGSGSGYLSTMAGLLLGQYGINHGIEYHEDIVEYAYERLDEFLKSSKVVDEHDFCEPVFTCGNCLTLDGNVQQYDRVYCGAACPEEYEAYIKNLVKINGILIMPLNDKLLKITRVSETVWTTVKVLSVSFAPLILPPPTKKGEVIEHAKLGVIKPPTLLQLCRFKLRKHLRSNIESEHPELKEKLKKLPLSPRSSLQLFIVRYGENESDSDSDDVGLDFFNLLSHSIMSESSSQDENDESDNDEVKELLSSTTVQDADEEQVDGSDERSEKRTKVKSWTLASSATVQDAAEEQVDCSDEESEKRTKVKSLTIVHDHAEQIVDSLSEIKKMKRDAMASEGDLANIKKVTRCGAKATDSSSKVKKGTKSSFEVGKRAKNISKTGNSTSKDEKKATKINDGSPRAKNKLNTLENQDSCPNSSLDFTLPPSQSTRSRTNALKRKHSCLDDEPSTSTGCSSRALKKKISVKSSPKKRPSEPKYICSKEQSTEKTVSRVVKVDANNKILEENSHTYYLTQRIVALPLPPFLKNYVNYKRDNV